METLFIAHGDLDNAADFADLCQMRTERRGHIESCPRRAQGRYIAVHTNGARSMAANLCGAHRAQYLAQPHIAAVEPAYVIIHDVYTPACAACWLNNPHTQLAHDAQVRSHRAAADRFAQDAGHLAHARYCSCGYQPQTAAPPAKLAAVPPAKMADDRCPCDCGCIAPSWPRPMSVPGLALCIDCSAGAHVRNPLEANAQ